MHSRFALLTSLLVVAALLLAAPSAFASISDSGSGSSVATAGGGGGGGNPEYFELSNTGTQSSAGATASSGGVRWPSAGTSKQWKEGHNPDAKATKELGVNKCDSFASNGCVLWNQTAKRGGQWGYEIHHPLLSQGPFGDNYIMGWNVMVYREGERKPIFQRKVCKQGAGGDTDSDRSQSWNSKWWLCGHTTRADGGFQKPGDTTAGMLGRHTAFEKGQCKANWAAGTNKPESGRPRSWTGQHLNHACYWEGKSGMGPEAWPSRFTVGKSANQRESIYLRWTFSNSGRARIYYRIAGAPGKFYAVHVVALNWKERMMPIFRDNSVGKYPTNGSGAADYQYFKVYRPNPIDAPIPCSDPRSPQYPCPRGESEQVSPFAKPSAAVTLDADSVLQARDRAEQTVNINTEEDLTDKQAIMPMAVGLMHYTPQGANNGARRGNGYGADFANYDSDIGMRFPAANGRAGNLAYLPQPPHIESKTSTVGDITTNDYQQTWLKGTLNNPCSTQDKNHFTGGSWPSNQKRCVTSSGSASNGNGVKNSWDDYFAGKGRWENRWVQAGNADRSAQYGRIGEVSLRCNDPAIGRKLVDTGSGDACPDTLTYFPLSKYAKPKHLSEQYAQGFVRADNPRGGTRSAAARIRLFNNAPDNITQAALYERTGGEVQGSNHRGDNEDVEGDEISNRQQPITNSTNDVTELNFCRQGLPAGTRLFQSQADPDKDDSVQARHTGDPQCSGFAVRWNWSTNPADCDVAKGAQTPPASAFMPPTALAMDPSNRSIDWAASVLMARTGVYGHEYGGSEVAYNNFDTTEAKAKANGYGQHNPSSARWSKDVEVNSAGPSMVGTHDRNVPNYARNHIPTVFGNLSDAYRPPYAGNRPGLGFGEKKCSKQITGRWNVGHWEKVWAFDARKKDSNSSAGGNCRFMKVRKIDGNGVTYGGYIQDDVTGLRLGHQPPGAPDGADDYCFTKKVATNNNGKVDRQRDYYAFGYWHWQYLWVWGTDAKGKTPDPYDCAMNIGANDIDKTNALDPGVTLRFAGRIREIGANLGRTDFRYDATGSSTTSPGRDSRYNAQVPSQVRDTGTNELRAPAGNYSGNVNTVWVGSAGSHASTGPDSWKCTVTRTNGRVTAGAWRPQTPNFATPDTPGDEAEPGWGANNTGPRIENGQYVAQFAFKGLSSAQVSNPSGFCQSKAYGNAETRDAGVCWSMRAGYDGRTDYQWAHQTEENNPHSDESSAMTRVYGPRNSR